MHDQPLTFFRRIGPWLPAVAWILVLYTASAQTSIPSPSRWGLTDKQVHFAVYAVLGVTLGWGWLRARGNVSHRIALGSGLLYGVLDEVHQAFVPGRAPEIGDVMADWAGVIVGYSLVIGVVRLWRRSRQR